MPVAELICAGGLQLAVCCAAAAAAAALAALAAAAAAVAGAVLLAVDGVRGACSTTLVPGWW
jgi:hypothetical protein